MEVNVSLRPVHEHPQEPFQQNLENQKLVRPVFMKKYPPCWLQEATQTRKKKTIFLQFNHPNITIIGVQRRRMI